MKSICLLILCVAIFSCSNRLRVPRNQDGKSTNFSAMREIMKYVKSQNPKPGHIIVVFQYVHTAIWSITLYRFKAIIYDAEKSRTLYLINDDDSQFKTYPSNKTPKFETMDLILKYYLDGRVNDLLRSQEHFKDGGESTTIFDINFSANTTREYVFDQLSFDDRGNLTTFKKMYQQKYNKQ